MTTNATTTHRVRWYVYSGGERLRHTATMRGSWPGWDAECSCGWKTQTGGATHRYVNDLIWLHKHVEVAAE